MEILVLGGSEVLEIIAKAQKTDCSDTDSPLTQQSFHFINFTTRNQSGRIRSVVWNQ